MNQIRLCRQMLGALCLCTCIGGLLLATPVQAQPTCPLPTTEPPLCDALLSTDCASGLPGECFPFKVRRNSASPFSGLEAVNCGCAEFAQQCGPVSIQGSDIRCPGPCLPPFPVGTMCQVLVNGAPTGMMFIDSSTFPDGTEFECGCVDQEPTGACCQPDGTCVVIPQSQCLGTYLGDGTLCQGTGACCFDADGDGIPETCQIVDEICCEITFGGAFQGFGTTCLADIACCFSNGSCVVANETCCLSAGGSLAIAGACLGDGNGNGVDDGCEDIITVCAPTPDRTGCQPTTCPVAGQECLPRCVRVFQDGTIVVETCECMDPAQCHLEFDAAANSFSCVGDCPPGFECRTTFTVDPIDLSKVFCCRCEPVPPAPCPLPPTGAPLCQALQQQQCDSTDPTDHICLPRKITITAAGLVAEECTCFAPGDECGPITVNGNIARCLGVCLVPPNNPGDLCLVQVDGVSTGMPSIDISTLPAGSTLDCGCGNNDVQGACCRPDGTCVVVPPSQCTGTYLGDGTVCQGTGACCFDADGDGVSETCQIADEVCCSIIFGGTFQGFGTACLADVPCCFTSGACVVMNEVCCLSAGGVLAPGGACMGDGNGNGVDDGCEDTPPICQPTPDRMGCQPTICPVAGQECLPRCLRRFQDGTIVVESCECISPNECHLEFDAASGSFTCIGACPPGFVCQTTTTVDPLDGSTIICCECVPETPETCTLNDTQPLCAPLLQTDCQSTDPTRTCLPRKITITPNGPVADECTCFGQGDDCGPITFNGTIARCLGLCPVPPNNPNDLCLVQVDGVSTGMPSIDTATLPIGAVLDCGCGGIDVQGACCLPDGTCVVVPPAQCQGVYLGDGTVCGGSGACCYDTDGDGIPETCNVVDEICCEVTFGGTFQGLGTMCQGKGACCYDPAGAPAGQCVVVDRICCDDIGGAFQGVGTICLGDANGDGSDDLCVPFDCQPDPNGQFCLPTVCPDPNEECLPRCVLILDDGTIRVVDCECRAVNECHLEWTPGTQPVCVGDCPPGFRCETRTFTTPIGTQICCDCVPDPPECEPTTDATACKPHICPDTNEQCVPRCVRVGPNGQVEVIDCDCRREDECRVSDFAAGDLPVCTGNCPPGQVCVENLIVLADGTVELCCDCAVVECDCPGDMNGDGIRNGLDIGGFVRCLLGNPLPGDNCACADVDEDGDVDIDDASFLVAVILSKAPCPKADPCPPEDLLLDISTGVDDNGNVIPVGSPDDQWVVLSEPPPVGVLPRPALVIPPNGAWNTIPGTQWISANATGPNGTYVYQLCFCLDKRFSNPLLDIAIRADDEFDLILNGVFLGSFPGGFNSANPLLLSYNNPGLFRAGENCLQVVVRNLGGVVTGFNLQGSVRAINGKCCCEPADLVRDLASGRDDGGNLIASGADDDTWTVTVDAAGGTVPRPATVINPNPAWLTIPGTKWIAASYTGPNGVYTYEYCFCLEKWFEDAQLVLDLRADDRAEVYLNGNLVGMTPLTYSFNSPMPTNVTVTNQNLFRVGENCVEVVVFNTHGVVTGVNIDGSVTARNGLCCDDRAECGPTPDGTACEAVTCPNSGETCVPICYNVNGNVATVVDCDCRGQDECRAVVLDSIPPQIACVGGCPPGQDCIQRVVQRADGSVDYCCECVENPILGACCFSVGGCVVLSQAACEQQGGVYLGDFTNCLGDQACCLPNGFCIDTDAICCEIIYGGLPQGPGSVCLGDNNGDGRDDLCWPPDCGPVPGTLRCRNVHCPDPGEKCEPRCVRVEQGTTFVIEVLDCKCIGPNECHVFIDPLTQNYSCIGGCPSPDMICRTTIEDLGDGTQKVCCECVDIPNPLSCCNFETGQCLDLAPGATSCPIGFSLVPGPCGNLQACCLPSGGCVDTFLACCLEMGGMPQGAGTNCATTPCPQAECLPLPGTTRCSSTICPTPGEECLPRCVRVEPGTNFVIEVIDCNCISPNECHIEVDPFTNTYSCVGGCPLANQICRTTITDLPDGTQQVCCECVDAGPPMACCNLDDGLCVDLAPGTTSCPPGYTLVPGPCGNLEACCLPDGTCLDTFLACCAELGGMPQGAGSNCATTQCGDPVECLPVPGTPFCQPSICPIPGQECLPRCVRVDAGSTFVLEVVDCQCVSVDECHIEVDAANNYQCVGGCPPGFVCRTVTTDNADGTQTVCCECVPEVVGICPIATIQGADRCVNLQSSQCATPNPSSAFCAPVLIIVDPASGGAFVEQCHCVPEGECGALEIINGTLVQCAGQCTNGVVCQILADGMPAGFGPIDVLQFPAGTQITCGCP